MPTIIRHDNFCPISNLFTTDRTVFIIPIFQRPYAWEEEHIQDLLDDIDKAGARNEPYHYLSPVHLISISPAFLAPNGLVLGDFAEWEKNKDLELLRKNSNSKYFEGKNGSINVYYVIDGQQRLTTLYLLEHLRIRKLGGCLGTLYQQLKSGDVIPSLIQNPVADHVVLKNICGVIRTGGAIPGSVTVTSRSQERINEAALHLEKWISSCPISSESFISQPDFSISLICLKPDYGLTSFMTLNDRGKRLTVLEKFKSLLLEYIIFHALPGAMVSRLHTLFGNLYCILDTCIKLKLFSEDDQLMQLISVYIRAADRDGDSLWQSGEMAFEKYFKQMLKDAPANKNVSSIIQSWLDQIDSLTEQLGYLAGIKTGDKIKTGSTLLSTGSLHFSGSTLQDDYDVVLHSLGLQPGQLALMLKFRELFVGCDWHEKSTIRCHYDKSITTAIKKHLDDVRTEAKELGISNIDGYLCELSHKVENLPNDDKDCDCEISMLEVIESIQIFVWNRGKNPNANFVGSYAASLSDSITGFMQRWCGWWQSGLDSIQYFLSGNDNVNFSYVLKEYERKLGNNIHFGICVNKKMESSQLEHIFAQNIAQNPNPPFSGFSTIGFKDQADYQNNFLWRIGNMTLLSAPLNASLGNNMPYSFKADAYVKKSGIEITKKVGKEILTAGSEAAASLLLKARCAEVALFALERFFPKCI